MTNLTKLVMSDIVEKGQMSLATFMCLLSKNREHGYYSNIQEIGHKGDFVTSPEISQLFGEIIGIWCVNLWQILGCPNNIMIVELGPGNGTLAMDMVKATKNIPGFHQAISMHFIEIGKNLIIKQQITLGQIEQIKKYWHTNIDQLPKQAAIFIANEFFDALPISQYIKCKEQWYEIGIDIEQSSKKMNFCKMSIDEKTQNILLQDYSHVPHDGIVELCKESVDVVKQISVHINKYNGGGLFIDYGYIDTISRVFISSLQAIKNHKYCSILHNLGNADISTHVNFTALVTAAQLCGIKTYGPITQRKFLLNMCINDRKEMLLRNTTSTQQETMIRGYNRLISPQQMGLLFKVIALTKHEINQFIGF